MRAVQVTDATGPDGVKVGELPAPEGELLIDVRAAGVGFPDLLMSRGEHQLKQPLPFTLGWEASGEVVAAPAGSEFAPGDRVMTLRLGAAAERIVADPAVTAHFPDRLTWEQAAALPLNYLTALAALQRRGRLAEGETVLVHGAAGGAGSAAVQVAKALGARVVAAVSNDDKAEVAVQAGADQVVIGDDFRSQLDGPVNLVVDVVGGTERLKDNLRALAPEGRVVIVGFAGGEIPELRVNRLLLGNTDVVGCSFSALALTPGGLGDAMGRLGELTGEGGITPIVGDSFSFDRAADALRAIDERRATGKLVLVR